MQKVLVTGVERAVGSGLARELASRFQVRGITCEPGIEFDRFDTFHADGDLTDALVQEITATRPTWVVHCGPTSYSSWDEVPTLDADQVVSETSRIAEAAAAVGSRLTLISSDAVFQGPRLFHAIHHKTAAHTPYAATALAVENAVLAHGFQVVRTHVFGWTPVLENMDFSERLFQRITEGGPVELDPQQFATPILAQDLGARLLRAFDYSTTSAIWHIAGAERVNQVRWAYEMAGVAGLGRFAWKNAALGGGGRMQETSLDCRAARSNLRLSAPLVRETLQRFCELHTATAGKGRPAYTSGRAMAA